MRAKGISTAARRFKSCERLRRDNNNNNMAESKTAVQGWKGVASHDKHGRDLLPDFEQHLFVHLPGNSAQELMRGFP